MLLTLGAVHSFVELCCFVLLTLGAVHSFVELCCCFVLLTLGAVHNGYAQVPSQQT